MNDYEFNYVRSKIRKLIGVDLNRYKSTQMQRRLQTFLIRSGYRNWPSLFRAIQDDPAAIDELRNYLTINVSYFFRDPDKYKHLQEVVIPELLRARPRLRVWSAGCSRGHEPYSLAIALAEISGPYRQHRIVATDIDRGALEWAQAGGPYAVEEMAYLPPPLLEGYFELREGKYWFTHKSMRRKMRFCEHNLLADPFTLPDPDVEEGYDLILCRNVVIYFTKEGKQQLYGCLRGALRPGGVLFIGSTEIIHRPADLGLESISMSFYRRIEADAGR